MSNGDLILVLLEISLVVALARVMPGPSPLGLVAPPAFTAFARASLAVPVGAALSITAFPVLVIMALATTMMTSPLVSRLAVR